MASWTYEKIDENYKRQTVTQYSNDANGKITGKHVINVHAYFDENPEERKRLGWIKHIRHTNKEIQELCPYNKQSQNLIITPTQIDEWTVEDTYHAIDKSEEQMRLEELLETADSWMNDDIAVETPGEANVIFM